MKQTSTILIVDDEPAAQRLMERLLAKQGYQLATASDGPEALAKAAELTPDIILLDVMMPGMDGFEVCKRLRTDPLLAEVPIIMLTALDNQAARLAGIEAGADDFISKPFDRIELQARIRTIIRLNRYRRLQVERARFARVIEQADDGYLVINDRDEVLYANPKARFYLGLLTDQDEPVTKTFLTLARKQYHLHPQEAWTTWPESAADPSPRYLVQPESSTAQAFWLQVDILDMPAGPDGDRIVRLRDVTEQMALQRDMRGFHTLISHKLRTPLIGMSSSLELLIKHAPKLSTPDIIELGKTALKSMQRLQDEVEGVLQYAHTSGLARSGKGFNLDQLESLVARIRNDLGLEAVSLASSGDLDQARVLLSQRAIELVLRETLGNAKKFHPKQAPVVELSISRVNEGQVSLQISDDGLTLSPEQLAHAWTPYYQGEKYFTGEASGMGLGLSMVASLVWEVGGTCQIYNREGPGVTVELTLPLAENSR